MNIDTTQQMQQTQMRKMDGTGGGQGQGSGGMKDIMQNLSSEDRVALQEQMSSLSPEQRADMKEQLKAVDSTGMSGEDYAQSLLNLFTDEEEEEKNDVFTPTYA